MAAENLNLLKWKRNTSTKKSTLSLVTLESFKAIGSISAEKYFFENRENKREMYVWGYGVYPQPYICLLFSRFSKKYFSAAIIPNTLKRSRITKFEVLFLVLVLVFH